MSSLSRCFSSSLKLTARRMGPPKRTLSSLPRLPVPPLQATLKKYLLSVRALLGAQEFAETEKVVRKFGEPSGIGSRLHALLEERAKTQVNWLSDWWLRCAYLEFREPVVAYSSPGLVMPQQTFNTKDDQLLFASKLVVASLAFKTLIDKNQLPQETSGGVPLDMSQYKRIFGTCRVPKLPRDQLELHPESKHIIVAHQNHFFRVDVYGSDGTLLNETQIYDQLKSVVQQSQEITNPVGILSSEHRDTWAGSYKRLCTSALNKDSVETIQRGLFLLCLDKPDAMKAGHNYLTRTALSTIHGCGASANSGNRWYDKTVQFIISEDGCLGLTYEHSPSEGPPITSLVDFIMEFIDKKRGHELQPSPSVQPTQRLTFEISSETLNDIETANSDLDALIKDLDMTCFTFDPFGKNFIKSQKLSPDSVIQMALQLAFYRLSGSLAATYESASTRMFELGRTETIRSASVEALQFCQAMQKQQTSASERANALRAAVSSHKAYTVAANAGLGVDRHFLGLKRIAVENGMNIPDLYLDAGYTASGHFRLSTSQVPARCDALMGYGPVVPDGYGCCYNPHPASVNFAVSAWHSSPATDAAKFAGAVQQSLVDVHDVLLASQASKL